MQNEFVKKYWSNNAEAWTELTRAGYDVYRDNLNTPAFLDILPNVSGLVGLDIGCGEGHNTRLLKKKGAEMFGVDIIDFFIQKATEMEKESENPIRYTIGNATDLPFETHQFDFATSFMCLMDVPDLLKSLNEAYRVIKPKGFFQFSISHPCFSTPHRKNLRDENGNTYAIEVGSYFDGKPGIIDEWIFNSAPDILKQKFEKFKVPTFHRTLTEWFSAIIKSGFIIEQINEPAPSKEVFKSVPAIQDASVVSYFLHIRCRK